VHRQQLFVPLFGFATVQLVNIVRLFLTRFLVAISDLIKIRRHSLQITDLLIHSESLVYYCAVDCFLLAGASSILAGARSILAGAGSILAGARSILAGAHSILAGARSIPAGARSILAGAGSILAGAGSILAGVRSILAGAYSILFFPAESLPQDFAVIYAF